MRKDEIRHDPIRQNIVKVIEYLKENQSTVLKIFLGLVVLISVFSFYNNMGNERIESSSEIAGLAQNTYINGNIDEALVKFERVLNDYPKTLGALQSMIYLLNDAISKEDYKSAKNMIDKLKIGISSINDPVVQATLYKIQGDIELYDGNMGNALSFYNKAVKSSKNPSIAIKYKLDVITVLLKQEEYKRAINMLKDIQDFDDIGYNEKNKAEELQAFAVQKSGT